MSTFEAIWEQGKRIARFEGVQHLLEWDQETYMPKGSAQSRADQIEQMASLIHKEKTDPRFVERLNEIDVKSLEPWQQAAVREWREDLRKALALPNDFVKAFAKLSAESLVAWQSARKESDFKSFAPYLSQIFEMCREQAELLCYEESPYDALMDLYEPGMTVSKIAPLFKTLGDEISALLPQIPEVDNSCLNRQFDEKRQLDFGNLLLEAMGYNLECGRLDLSAHPFSTSMHPTDSRVTTRMTEHSFFDHLSAVLHEGGHGLYEMQLDKERFGTPIGEARSLGIHESQSRTWETFVGQSRPFWEHFFPLLKKSYDLDLDLDTFYRAINRVKPSFIRVEADEVTYCLHVILRFELERALIEGDLQVADLPAAWNEKMKKLLGVVPQTDLQGCLQDIHWSMGAVGYFPTYALGTVYAAQFFEAMTKQFPNWEQRLAKGELHFIRDWQKEKIHKWGRTYSSAELVTAATGRDLEATPYLTYLKGKYLSPSHQTGS
ncbi:MAG: carboxypeptidase M32 [Chlamydiae bacterium]|nr:carboxypeptidase M32 [Chlamydiota bacterium]